MKITQDSVVFQKAHDALAEAHNIHMNPAALQTVVETVLDGRVTDKHAERRYRQGIQQAADLHDRLVKSEYVIRRTVELLDHCLAWSGTEQDKQHVREQLGALLADLQSISTP